MTTRGGTPAAVSSVAQPCQHLMDAAVSYARANKLHLVLEVLTKDAAAIRLYERLGWQRFGETVHTFARERFDAACFVAPA
ncbi:GNAT family N-acetyltransferase [Streptomyces sp. NPDC002809]|uniref:GNAT family N-acetyltransferase n=1 Tax=Streptomyces sp. NPDC002809 TaxID=3154433 RepID=UPI003318FF71